MILMVCFHLRVTVEPKQLGEWPLEAFADCDHLSGRARAFESLAHGGDAQRKKSGKPQSAGFRNGTGKRQPARSFFTLCCSWALAESSRPTPVQTILLFP